MALYGKNFRIVLLIMFYSIMNLDNANCPLTREEIDICKDNMTEYCGASIENPAESEIEEVVESHSEDEEYYSDARADSLGSENDLESDSGDGESYNPRVHNLTNTLLCVRWAIYSFYGGQSLEDRNTPAYVIDYFMFYVNPYVTDILTPDEYCRSEGF